MPTSLDRQPSLRLTLHTTEANRVPEREKKERRERGKESKSSQKAAQKACLSAGASQRVYENDSNPAQTRRQSGSSLTSRSSDISRSSPRRRHAGNGDIGDDTT